MSQSPFNLQAIETRMKSMGITFKDIKEYTMSQKLEDRIQAEFHTWMNHNYPDLVDVCYAIPNGGLRSDAEAMRLRGMGVLPGIPDYHISVPSGRYLTLYIEFKVEGKITNSGDHAKRQAKRQLALRAQGHRVEVCDNLQQAQKVAIEHLGEVRPRELYDPAKNLSAGLIDSTKQAKSISIYNESFDMSLSIDKKEGGEV